MSIPHNFGAGLFPEDEEKKTRHANPAPTPEPVSDESMTPEYSRSDFDAPADPKFTSPTFTPAAFPPADDRRFDDLGLPQTAPPAPTGDSDIFGDVVPVDDAQDAKAAALRTQRRESVESRGVEPLDDRIHGAEIPARSAFEEDRRARRGGRGRRPRDEGQEPRRDGRRGGSRMDRPDRPDPRRRREESSGAPLSDSLMGRPMDLGRPDMGRPDMGRPDMGRQIDADTDAMSRSRVVRPIPGPSYDRSFSTGMIEQSPPSPMYTNPPAGNLYGAPSQGVAPISGSGYGMAAQGSDVSGLRREIDDLKAQLNRSLMSGGPSPSSAYGGGESFSPRVVHTPAPPVAAPPVSTAAFAALFGAQRVVVLADVASLQRSAKKTFGRVVSFSKLLTNVLRGRGAVRAIAFLGDRDANDPAFIQHLRQTGFEVRRTDMSAGGHHRAENGGTLPLEASRLANRVDVIVLAGGDPELMSLIPALRAQGCRVELASFPETASDPTREAADSYTPLSREDLI